MSSAAFLNDDQILKIVHRLSQDETLRLPWQQTRGDESVTMEMRSKYLHALLLHDPGVFLERHGDQVLDDELQYFEALRTTNYEVKFYLNLLEDIRKAEAGAKKPQLGSVAKNRRLAHLERLEQQGYFSEEAMRNREPYLHHLYIGQYAGERPPEIEAREERAGPSSAANAGPSTKVLPNATTAQGNNAGPVPRASASLASSIMDRQDELQLLLRREAEREAHAMQEEEEESESEDEDLDENLDNGAERKKDNIADRGAKGIGDRGQLGDWPPPEAVTHEERIEYADAFLDVMKQKFLAGQDQGIDYKTIDRDASLDQHFAKEAERDAEDAYFDAD